MVEAKRKLQSPELWDAGGKRKSMRGFALWDKAKLAAVCSKAGRSVNPTKRLWSVNPELASAAGRKGGMAPRRIVPSA